MGTVSSWFSLKTNKVETRVPSKNDTHTHRDLSEASLPFPKSPYFRGFHDPYHPPKNGDLSFPSAPGPAPKTPALLFRFLRAGGEGGPFGVDAQRLRQRQLLRGVQRVVHGIRHADPCGAAIRARIGAGSFADSESVARLGPKPSCFARSCGRLSESQSKGHGRFQS